MKRSIRRLRRASRSRRLSYTRAAPQFKAALEAAERARELFGASDRLGLTRSLQVIGASMVGLGSIEAGEHVLREALASARALNAPRLVAMALGDLGGARNRCGDFDGAREMYAEALAYHRSHGFARQAASVAGNLAEVEFGSGRHHAALQHEDAALEGHRALANDRAVAIDLFNMAAYLIALDRFEEGRAAASEALERSRELQARMFEVWALQHLAAAAVLEPEAQAEGARPRVERAAALLGFVDARLAELGGVREYTERQEYDRVLTALRARLGDPALAQLTERGRRWSGERAFMEAGTL